MRRHGAESLVGRAVEGGRYRFVLAWGIESITVWREGEDGRCWPGFNTWLGYRGGRRRFAVIGVPRFTKRMRGSKDLSFLG
jgi:hypothetical protein